MAQPLQSNRRTTHWTVRLTDRAAAVVITTGGLTVIATILGIGMFLIWVAVPLFCTAHVTAEPPFEIARHAVPGRPLIFELDEYVGVGVALWPDGTLAQFDARSGAELAQADVVGPHGPRITAWSRPLSGGRIALGLSDGTIRLGQLGFTSEFVEQRFDRAELDAHGRATWSGGIVERVGSGHLRWTHAIVDLASEPVTFCATGSPIVLLDYHATLSDGRIVREVLAGITAEGTVRMARIRRKENLLTGAQRLDPQWFDLPAPPHPDQPAALLLNEEATQLVLGWSDGTVSRYDLRDPAHAQIAETRDVVSDDHLLTTIKHLIGTQSLIVGDSAGRVSVWFTVPRPHGETSDGLSLERIHDFSGHDAAVTAVTASPRNRCFATADASGAIALHHATTGRTLATIAGEGVGIARMQITPKADTLVALDHNCRARRWNLDNPHPETTLHALFGRLWYEGDPQPSFTWQSSGGTDAFEPKLSLTPLIFGSLKATLYSMVFAIPIALLAAVYSSQFLDPKTRSVVKPTIEMMASLPSVVLGFIAALVLAPVVERHLVTVLLSAACIPATLWFAGHAWDLLPRRIAACNTGARRLLLCIGLLGLAGLVSRECSPAVERLMFGGNIMAWLDGQVGTGTSLWGLVTMPVILVLVLHWRARRWRRFLSRKLITPGLLSEAWVELLSMIAATVLSAVTAWAVGETMTALGFDLRGTLVGTYAQRNSLVVGFVIGFAVIPIVYTVSEDALSAVPEHLKAGSLACGASAWQTTCRVVIPIAASGMFSAVMIGLGRAVGETMIVVMAAGNTAIMDINPFNGLRALSANIAVELPEAARNGTLYRVLFLAGLVLFGLTFVINTVAELVRLRFRKRAGQL